MNKIINNVLKTSVLFAIIVLAAANTIYAKSKDDEYTIEYNFEEDRYTGPGVKIADNTWNGTNTNRIYGYGDLNGIVGDEVCEFNALSSDGPGMNVYLNGLSKSKVYNDGGPGFTVNGFTLTENTYVDNGPTVSIAQVNPADYVKLLTMKPGDFKFNGGTREDKINR